jgi:cytochrome c biogenesis protein
MVEYGLLARGEDHRLAGESAAIRELFQREWQLTPGASETSDTVASTNTKDQ